LYAPLWSYFAFAMGYIVYMTFIFAWLRNEHQSWVFSTVVWLVLAAGIGLSPFVWRPALDRWHPCVTLSASCAATFLGTAILLLNAGAPGLLVSALVFGLGVFIAPSSIAILVRKSLPPVQLAKGMTFFTVLFAIGQSIGPVVAGWIGDLTTLRGSLLFGLSLLSIATVLPLPGTKTVDVRRSSCK